MGSSKTIKGGAPTKGGTGVKQTVTNGPCSKGSKSMAMGTHRSK